MVVRAGVPLREVRLYSKFDVFVVVVIAAVVVAAVDDVFFVVVVVVVIVEIGRAHV